MSHFRLIGLTTLAMLAFAGNSILCRIALRDSAIDAISFTTIRVVAGAITLFVVASMVAANRPGKGNWPSAVALLVYALAFSFAYKYLSTGTGALLLFGAVQVTMIAHGLRMGERLTGLQLIGLTTAVGGVIGLVLPGLKAPPLAASLLMISAGIAWGVYSLRGKGAGDPTQVTAGNFLRAAPICLLLSLLAREQVQFNHVGLASAVASGALTSGIGYAIWYSALPSLKATTAATVQLSVPLLAAVGGVLLLGEPLSWRLFFASIAILGGIALIVWQKQRPKST